MSLSPFSVQVNSVAFCLLQPTSLFLFLPFLCGVIIHGKSYDSIKLWRQLDVPCIKMSFNFAYHILKYMLKISIHPFNAILPLSLNTESQSYYSTD